MVGSKLTTGECARVLGTTTAYVRGEIRDGRIPDAIQFKRPNGRTFYRVPLAAFRAYCEAFAPAALPELDAWAKRAAA